MREQWWGKRRKYVMKLLQSTHRLQNDKGPGGFPKSPKNGELNGKGTIRGRVCITNLALTKSIKSKKLGSGGRKRQAMKKKN